MAYGITNIGIALTVNSVSYKVDSVDSTTLVIDIAAVIFIG